ncbi:MAG: hypothetical protein SFV23_21425 [Planctomycetaceae bacterium]|nr:hypothetical protein [Planctomycetaceae bacterium]
MTETHWADYADARYYDTRELVSSRHSPTPYNAAAITKKNLGQRQAPLPALAEKDAKLAGIKRFFACQTPFVRKESNTVTPRRRRPSLLREMIQRSTRLRTSTDGRLAKID